MNDLLDLLLDVATQWARDGIPTAVLVAVGLAALGWLLPRGVFRLAGIGRRAILRTAFVSAVVLVAVGALASALLYALSGVQLAAAWDSDPWGGLVYFVVTGAQLATLGLVVMAARTLILAGRGAHRTLG